MRREGTTEVLAAIAKALGLSLDDLFRLPAGECSRVLGPHLRGPQESGGWDGGADRRTLSVPFSRPGLAI